MDSIIKVENVSFKYDAENGRNVIDELNLEIERGSFTVILGHNGSGKSTLAKLLNGLYQPTSGKVTVDGLDTSVSENNIPVKRKIGLVFQNPDNQIVASIVEEDVAFGPENLGYEPEDIRKRVDEALKAVKMYDFRTFAPHKLSGGQKQRVAIAGILAMTPECIVLDEPTAMLDPSGRGEVMETLRYLNKEMGITVVLITHFMEETVYADRVLVMSAGKIMLDGSANDVFSKSNILSGEGLSVPQTTELLEKLEKHGIKLQKGIVSVDECIEELYGIISRRN